MDAREVLYDKRSSDVRWIVEYGTDEGCIGFVVVVVVVFSFVCSED